MVCREAGLIPNAIEEVLRFDSPVITWRRKTKVALRIQGAITSASARRWRDSKRGSCSKSSRGAGLASSWFPARRSSSIRTSLSAARRACA
jgi:hypothetical protein